MGVYENTFRVIRQCYQELGRSPESPLATWQDAFKPHHFIAFLEYVNGQWTLWPYDFPANNELPGEGGEFLSVSGYVGVLIEFIVNQFQTSSYLSSMLSDDEDSSYLEGIPHWLKSLLKEMKLDLETLTLTREVAFLQIAHKLVQALPQEPRMHRAVEHQALLWLLGQFRTWLRGTLGEIIETHFKFRRL